jgi:outer membrane receptor for ferrienterochelin and colicin
MRILDQHLKHQLQMICMHVLGGNPDLKPEESISYEIGVDQKLN